MGVHEGHRERMRARFRQEGLDGFADHEVLELMLFDCIPRGDVNPLAHRLLEVFGSFHGVLEAGMEQLLAVEGVGEKTAVRLAMVLPLLRRYSQSVVRSRRRIQTRADAAAFCLALLTGWRTERFYLVSLSADMELIGTRLIAQGSLAEVNAYPRIVLEAALNQNAHSVLLCHNHPGGSLFPSSDDVATTAHLQRLMEAVGVTLLDHLIVADGKTYSMVQQGDLQVGAPGAFSFSPSLVAADSTGKVLPKRREYKENPREE